MNQYKVCELFEKGGWKAKWSVFENKPVCDVEKNGRQISLFDTFISILGDTHIGLHYYEVSDSSFVGESGAVFIILTTGGNIVFH